MQGDPFFAVGRPVDRLILVARELPPLSNRLASAVLPGTSNVARMSAVHDTPAPAHGAGATSGDSLAGGTRDPDVAAHVVPSENAVVDAPLIRATICQEQANPNVSDSGHPVAAGRERRHGTATAPTRRLAVARVRAPATYARDG